MINHASFDLDVLDYESISSESALRLRLEVRGRHSLPLLCAISMLNRRTLGSIV